jgi:hypothetical protein
MPKRNPIRLRDGEFVSTGQRAMKRGQVVTPRELLGVSELSELQSAGASSKKAAARARVFPGSVTSPYRRRTELIACPSSSGQ